VRRAFLDLDRDVMPLTTPPKFPTEVYPTMEYRSIDSLVFVVGRLGPSGDILLAPLRAEVTGRITWQLTPRIDRAALGDRVGTPGAACLAWDAL
jgi:hypothetical protein